MELLLKAIAMALVSLIAGIGLLAGACYVFLAAREKWGGQRVTGVTFVGLFLIGMTAAWYAILQ